MTKITIDRATVEQALEAIEEFVSNELTFGQRYTNEGQCLLDSITALSQALSDSVEQPAEQEPVAWRYKIVDCFGRPVWTLKTPKTDTRVLESQPLYANPQTIDKSAAIRVATALGWEPKNSDSVEWVGLTDEEVIEALKGISFNVFTVFDIANAIAAKLKEKNNG